jgi:hypothetical protein
MHRRVVAFTGNICLNDAAVAQSEESGGLFLPVFGRISPFTEQ